MKHICVIGSGATGITAIKQCREEGLEVTCYEKSNFIGGLWKYREEDEDGLASVTKSTIINSSKELSAYSDFPPPKEFATYMHNTRMLEYFTLYAKHFNVEPHILFQHEVIKLVPNDDYDETGRWKVTVLSLSTNEIISKVFDGVLVCTGHHVKPSIPSFKGQEKFKGKIIHTHSYKRPNPFEDKIVVIVGIGNSGGDAAVELSPVSKKVYLSTRRGAWVNYRIGFFGKPFDALFIRRIYTFFVKILPFSLINTIFQFILNIRMDHEMYDLKPEYGFLSQHPMVNDAFPNRLLSGTIILKSNIQEFTEDGIIFVGEKEVTKCDAVILATGYEISFPFLDKSIIDPSGNEIKLYYYIFHPTMRHPETLGFIGFVQSFGPLIPVSEMQARWFVQVFLGKRKLPTSDVMLEDIKTRREKIRKRYYNCSRHTIQIDWVSYMDELASKFGVKPNLLKYAFKDPVLAYKLLFGPCLPYHFRLEGPNKWSGAREAILTADERINASLKTRYKSKTESSQSYFFKAYARKLLSSDKRVFVIYSIILMILFVISLLKWF